MYLNIFSVGMYTCCNNRTDFQIDHFNSALRHCRKSNNKICPLNYKKAEEWFGNYSVPDHVSSIYIWTGYERRNDTHFISPDGHIIVHSVSNQTISPEVLSSSGNKRLYEESPYNSVVSNLHGKIKNGVYFTNGCQCVCKRNIIVWTHLILFVLNIIFSIISIMIVFSIIRHYVRNNFHERYSQIYF